MFTSQCQERLIPSIQWNYEAATYNVGVRLSSHDTTSSWENTTWPGMKDTLVMIFRSSVKEHERTSPPLYDVCTVIGREHRRWNDWRILSYTLGKNDSFSSSRATAGSRGFRSRSSLDSGLCKSDFKAWYHESSEMEKELHNTFTET